MHQAIHSRRVVVTGIGTISPLGLNVKETWKALLDGQSGAGKITLFDPKDCAVQIAAEVKGFDVTASIPPLQPQGLIDHAPITQAMSPKEARRVGRFVHLGVAAGLQAYHDSQIDAYRPHMNPERMGVNIGVGIGGLGEIETVHSHFLDRGFSRITPFFITQVIANMPAGYLSIMLHLKGLNHCNVSACTSSAQSIGEAFRAIQRGEADWMLAGGAESTICALAVGGFASMKALSTRNNEPALASRPYDKNRDGFLIAEGAASLVLEDRDLAIQRKAPIYAELVGYGTSADAYHITAPAVQGDGGRRSMALALKDAGLDPHEIDYINSHSTSTPIGDLEEARAIAKIFGSLALDQKPFISATKSATGHLLGAAGAFEALLCLMSLKNQIIPGTRNLEEIDPEIGKLGLKIAAENIHTPVKTALSNSFGFGGANATLIFRQL
jgi:3-oxoacyl-[acyl-carrier-protein] synthase II